MWSWLSISVSAWGQARSKLGGVDMSILNHAFMLIFIALLLHIMVQYLCLFSLILQDLHEEGECRQLEFWTGKEQIWETYSAQLQKSWKFTENYFQIIKDIQYPSDHEHEHALWVVMFVTEDMREVLL
jgi:hypothetical protein